MSICIYDNYNSCLSYSLSDSLSGYKLTLNGDMGPWKNYFVNTINLQQLHNFQNKLIFPL
jgi:hypothetical protein